MDITGSRIVVMGGPGLVGLAVCRRLLQFKPAVLTLTALTEQEALGGVKELSPIAGTTQLKAQWGNIFVRSEFKNLPRSEILTVPERRARFLLDTLEPLSQEITEASCLYQLLRTERPDVVIDCVNTATGLAYQDVFEESRKAFSILESIHKTGSSSYSNSELVEKMESMLGAQYTPQLIRHIQILWSGLTDFKVKTYLKIGTTGTGGMGLNIPYTHSEDKPSRVLLAKSAMAGAHTMLLFLLGRTALEHAESLAWSPDKNIKAFAPIIKEIKPAAAIAWKGIHYGEVRRKGRPVDLYDADPRLALDFKDSLKPQKQIWSRLGSEVLKAPYIDTGENGIFSRGEFEAITDEGQMEFITPEEIADSVATELIGGNSGADCVSAFDSVVLGPTYRAGLLRARALEKLGLLEQETGVPSIAFENLGPPRLSKLLFELHLILQERELLDGKNISAEELSRRSEQQIKSNEKLRASMLSLGLAVIFSDSKVLRGPNLIIPSAWDTPADGVVTEDHFNRYAKQGWVDLRVQNMQAWIDRLDRLKTEALRADSENTGSVFVRNKLYWDNVAKQKSLGSVISWIFLREENGERGK